ncbi:MAG: MoaD/ThiS family protein [Flavobacteriales bacterium]|jgi:molybdopterin converting factor small subunit|nr:MoaD/ThiS family protein [Flavobacteriales bacterium]MBK6892071.1 MoaD/ThiS family protein [Flavobacteriales bacterium]MBK7246205.1 MoaD/ThiS family protein [Flavobacteriales bacterium]MBK7286218.1 MoaD/ThiS family protein [Flavobacteriales bacterium]MBK9060029.1 MoaD/ThiS family protein [Flavobacteriales bacterium]
MDIMLFGLIAEKAGTDRLTISAPDTGALRQALEERIEGLSSLSYALAVDRKITHENIELSGSEEIALLPPFAGG